MAAAVEGIPAIAPGLGRRVYDHVRRTQPEHALELGTAHGVAAAFLAAALDANDFGELTTVDHGGAAYDPEPGQVLARAGLTDRVKLVHGNSSYNWFLKEQIQQASDAEGRCEARYEFVHLLGCNDFSVDGLAVILIEKLLAPDGWLLIDNLEWTFEDDPGAALDLHGRPLSQSERLEPHRLAVFEMIVEQHPSYVHLIRDESGDGWAQKRPDPPPQPEQDSGRPLGASVAAELRRQRSPRGRPR